MSAPVHFFFSACLVGAGLLSALLIFVRIMAILTRWEKEGKVKPFPERMVFLHATAIVISGAIAATAIRFGAW